MGSDVVKGLSVLLCQYLYLHKCVEYLTVQQLVSKLPDHIRSDNAVPAVDPEGVGQWRSQKS